MPCNKLAVALAQINGDFTQLMTNPTAIKALAAVLTQITGYTVTVHDTQIYDWWNGYNDYARRIPNSQMTPIESIVNPQQLDFACQALCLRLTPTGIETRDGWNVNHPMLHDLTKINAITATFQAALQLGTNTITAQKISALLTQFGARPLNQTNTNGTITMQFKIGG